MNSKIERADTRPAPTMPAPTMPAPKRVDTRPTHTIRNAPTTDLTVRGATIRFSSLNEEQRSVEAVLSTDEPVLAFDTRRWEPILEVLRMDGVEHPDQVPLLDTHDRSSIVHQIGSTRDFRVENGKLIARNYYADTDLGNHAWELVRGGHLTDNSVGYQVLAYQDIEPGETATVNGETYTAPQGRMLRISTSWRLKENSNCPIGADPAAKMRDDNSQSTPIETQRNTTMFNKKQLAFLRSHGLQADGDAQAIYDGLSVELRAECDALVETQGQRAEPTDPTPEPVRANTPAVDPVAAARAAGAEAFQEGLRQERERASAVRAAGLENGIPSDVIENSVLAGHTIDQARTAFLEHIRTNRASAAPQILIPSTQGNARHLEAAMLLRSGQNDLAVTSFGADVTQQADERFRDMSLVDVCRMSLQLAGHDVPVGRTEAIRAGFSTGSLSVLLGNTAQKMMLKGYNNASATWRTWCNIGNLSDFNTHYLARMNDLGEMQKVPNGGEVKTSDRSEDSEAISIDTYAKNFGVTRQDIINDNMGAFTAIPMTHGVKAMQRISKAVYAHFLGAPTMGDAVELFNAASHGNLWTSQALTSDNLAESMGAFFAQTGPDGEPAELSAAYLIVPPALGTLAEQLVQSPIIMPVGSTDGKFPTSNIAGRKLKGAIIEPRLAGSSATYTDTSSTTWYLTADPAVTDTLMVAFLNGQQNPTLERFDAGPDRMGTIFRVYIDFGVKAADWRGVQQNTA